MGTGRFRIIHTFGGEYGSEDARDQWRTHWQAESNEQIEISSTVSGPHCWTSVDYV